MPSCEAASDAPCALPRATPLLYGFSEAVVDRPGYWPASVTVTGAWHAPHSWESGQAAYAPPPELAAFLDARNALPVAAITFGSMASVDGALPFPRTLLSSLAVRLSALAAT